MLELDVALTLDVVDCVLVPEGLAILLPVAVVLLVPEGLETLVAVCIEEGVSLIVPVAELVPTAVWEED